MEKLSEGFWGDEDKNGAGYKVAYHRIHTNFILKKL